jgi:DNA-binding MarR family transcriptional regulator
MRHSTSRPAIDGDAPAEAAGSIDRRLRAWIAFLRAHAAVTRQLEAELNAERGLSLSEYDALVQLAFAADRRLRMHELADRVLLSRSGVSRLVDRLVARGYVRRRFCATDGRGWWAELTQDGLDSLREAAPIHMRGVESHFLAALSDADREALAGALESILRRLGESDRKDQRGSATAEAPER